MKVYEWVANDGRAHFIYVDEMHHGDKISQRQAGKVICTKMFKHSDYCEVYMWTKREDVPTKFPLINRRTIIGKYEMKKRRNEIKPT